MTFEHSIFLSLQMKLSSDLFNESLGRKQKTYICSHFHRFTYNHSIFLLSEKLIYFFFPYYRVYLFPFPFVFSMYVIFTTLSATRNVPAFEACLVFSTCLLYVPYVFIVRTVRFKIKRPIFLPQGLFLQVFWYVTPCRLVNSDILRDISVLIFRHKQSDTR